MDNQPLPTPPLAPAGRHGSTVPLGEQDRAPSPRRPPEPASGARAGMHSRTHARLARRDRARPGGRRARRDTRAALFLAAAEAFSARGFDGVTVDAIAARAGANKAMLYYHFDGKLGLYREIVREMLRGAAARIGEIARSGDPPDRKVARFVHTLAELTAHRPWFPSLMMREIAEGAPRLDRDTLELLRGVFGVFTSLLAEGQTAGVFRPVHPVLAYMSVLGPLVLNAARERAAARPGRGDLPMFAAVPRAELVRHVQELVLRMLAVG